ncbi:MAG: YlxR family protein [Bacilli bacterium]|nr:YlxR family protein [Bacilli bacterium]
MKKIPMRTCIITREKLPKRELVRVVRTKDGVVVDPTGKINGRGAYLKLDRDVFEKAKKTKALDKHLEVEVDESVFEELNNLLDN